MIVNTAYPFMGGESPSIKLKLFENGVSNYPTEFDSRVNLTTEALQIPGTFKAGFLDVPFSKFSSLSITGHGGKYLAASGYFVIKTSTGEAITQSTTYTFKPSSQGNSTFTYTIPDLVKKTGAQIFFYGDSDGTWFLTDAVFDPA